MIRKGNKPLAECELVLMKIQKKLITQTFIDLINYICFIKA